MFSTRKLKVRLVAISIKSRLFLIKLNSTWLLAIEQLRLALNLVEMSDTAIPNLYFTYLIHLTGPLLIYMCSNRC